MSIQMPMGADCRPWSYNLKPFGGKAITATQTISCISAYRQLTWSPCYEKQHLIPRLQTLPSAKTPANCNTVWSGRCPHTHTHTHTHTETQTHTPDARRLNEPRTVHCTTQRVNQIIPPNPKWKQKSPQNIPCLCTFTHVPTIL